MQTVEQNESFYTAQQIERAKAARRLLATLGSPSVQDLKAAIRMNAIANNPVTTEDVNIAEAIYGVDLGTLKGKTVKTTPKGVRKNHIEIPSELYTKNSEITLYIDTMFVNEQAFLTTISRGVMYRTAKWMSKRTAPEYRSALDEVFTLYNNRDMVVARIHCDSEFRKVLDDIKVELGLEVTYAATNAHVPQAEHNNRTIKERVCAAFHRLPY